jgi:hypothetical protein
VKGNPSFSERDAMEFIVSEIADQAIRAGTPLSEIERKMLFFSESAPNARELGDLAEAFDREYDQDERDGVRRRLCGRSLGAWRGTG